MKLNSSYGQQPLRTVIFSILIILVCSSAFCGCVSAVAYDGSGTASDPYLIESAHDLRQLANDVNSGEYYLGKYFKVTADIDLAGEEWTPIGKFSPNHYSYPFAGTFDGGGHTISNLYINNPSKDNQGLFGVAFNANFKNINLINARVTGNDSVGGLIGWYGSGSGTQFIENCSVSGKISGSNSVGGIVGINTVKGISTTQIIMDSRFDGDVSGRGYFWVGGIAGFNLIVDGKVTITNCITSGTVSGLYYVGGIVGYIIAESGGKAYVISSTALNRYVNGGANVGRIVGAIHMDESGTIELTNNYGFEDMKNNITGKYFTDNIGINEINGANYVSTSKTKIPTPISLSTIKPTQTHSNHYHTIGLFIKIFIIVCVAIIFLIRKNRRNKSK